MKKRMHFNTAKGTHAVVGGKEHKRKKHSFNYNPNRTAKAMIG